MRKSSWKQNITNKSVEPDCKSMTCTRLKCGLANQSKLRVLWELKGLEFNGTASYKYFILAIVLTVVSSL